MFILRFLKFKWSMLLRASRYTPQLGLTFPNFLFFTMAAIKLNWCIENQSCETLLPGIRKVLNHPDLILVFPKGYFSSTQYILIGKCHLSALRTEQKLRLQLKMEQECNSCQKSERHVKSRYSHDSLHWQVPPIS